jgi:hypothetical protein
LSARKFSILAAGRKLGRGNGREYDSPRAVVQEAPTISIRIIVDKFAVFGASHLARPYDWRSVDIGLIIDPLVVNVVRGPIVDED